MTDNVWFQQNDRNGIRVEFAGTTVTVICGDRKESRTYEPTSDDGSTWSRFAFDAFQRAANEVMKNEKTFEDVIAAL